MTKTNTGQRKREKRNCSFELHCTLDRGVFGGFGGGGVEGDDEGRDKQDAIGLIRLLV